MFSSTYSSMSTNLHLPRRMLLQYSLQASPPPNEQPYPSSEHRRSFDSDVVMIFSVLLCLLIFSICVNCLIRSMFKCLVMITTQESNNLLNKEVISCGLDKRALKTFPVVKYSKEVKTQGLCIECVICLSEFKGGEKVRILPKCHHGFHVKCIDKWLSSHSSCPTCRQSLVDTCQKIIGCDGDDHQVTPSSSSTSTSPPSLSSSSSSTSTSTSTSTPSSSSSEILTISIVPLEREDLV